MRVTGGRGRRLGMGDRKICKKKLQDTNFTTSTHSLFTTSLRLGVIFKHKDTKPHHVKEVLQIFKDKNTGKANELIYSMYLSYFARYPLFFILLLNFVPFCSKFREAPIKLYRFERKPELLERDIIFRILFYFKYI